MLTFILIVALAQLDTVAITLSPDQPAQIISRVDAEREFKQLCTDGSGDRRLRALAAALNPLPNWEQFVINGDASVCNRNPKPIIPIPLKN